LLQNDEIVYWLNANQNRVEIASVFDARQNPVKIEEFVDL